MIHYKKILSIATMVLLLASCRKEDNIGNVEQPVGLGGDVTASTAIDKWIMDSLTKPYNISAKYRWDPFNVSLFKTLTPADESRIIPLFSAIKRVWINPYNAETGSENFIKQYSPKQFVLVGSVEYDFYTVTLGQAEGGNNIVFFDVNQNYDKDPITSIKRVIHTVHHEFGHILHQNVMYPQDFKGISTALGLPGYTATWFNISDAEAFSQGYATAYSRSGPDDDFVEMLSVMLTEGKSKWEEMKANTNPTARLALQQKEDVVVTYFRQVWNIDFYSLQTRVQNELNALYPPPAISQAFGFGKTYTRASVNPLQTTLLPQPAAFSTMYNSVKNAVTALPGGYNLTMDSMAVITNTATTAIVRFYLHQGTATTVYFADFAHTLTKNASGNYVFTYVSANGNGSIIKTAVQPMLNYFAAHAFNVTWYADPSVTMFPRARFTPVTLPGTFFIARLLP